MVFNILPRPNDELKIIGITSVNNSGFGVLRLIRYRKINLFNRAVSV